MRRLDFPVDDEAIERLVEDRAHEECVGAAQIGADASVGDRLRDGDFTGEQRLQRGDAAGVHEFDVEAMFLEMAGVVRDPRDRLVDGDGAVGETQSSWFCRLCGGRR